MIVDAISSILLSYISIIDRIYSALSCAVVLLNVLKASLAADTALFMSSLVPAPIEPITSSVAGLTTSMVSAEDELTHSPFM